MTGASLPAYNAGNAAATTCTITVPVTATGNGALLNSIGAGGVTNGTYSNAVAGTATLNVRSTVKMTKGMSTSPTSNANNTDTLPVPGNLYSPGTGTTTGVVGQRCACAYFSNPTGAALTGGSLTDPIPTGVTTGGTVATCAWATSAPTVAAGIVNPTSVSISGFSVPAASGNTAGSCYVEFWVKGTAAFASNINALSTSNISFDGEPTVEAATSATIRVNAADGGPGGVGAVTASKQFVKSGGALTTGTALADVVRVNKGEEFKVFIFRKNGI